MGANVYAYLSSFAFNSVTYNAGSGGPIRFELMKNGDPLEEWTGADEWPQFVAVVSKRLRVRALIRDIAAATLVLGVVANGSAVLLPKIGGTPKTIAMANLILIGVDPVEQTSRQAGGATLVFAHQSADGTTDPVS